MARDSKTCWAVNAGLIAYGDACELQRRLVEERKADEIPDVLLLCEHPHVITTGRNARRENLLATRQVLAQRGVELAETDRGGDVTYHGPGQMVGYPILDLGEHRRDVRWYVEQLEEVMIRTTADFGIEAWRSTAGHGVWVGEALVTKIAENRASEKAERKPQPSEPSACSAGEEKLGAVGVHLSRWVTSHGFAYNVATDLRYFDLIVPCGIRGRRATSLERVLGRGVSSEEIRERLEARFAEVFERGMRRVSREELLKRLRMQEFSDDAVFTATANVGAGSEA